MNTYFQIKKVRWILTFKVVQLLPHGGADRGRLDLDECWSFREKELHKEEDRDEQSNLNSTECALCSIEEETAQYFFIENISSDNSVPGSMLFN